MEKKYRQCPYCKSKKGFRIRYTIGGYGHEDRTFKGDVIDSYRSGADDIDNYAECLECGKLIDSVKLESK